jgi:hypothetical protein
MPLDLRGVRSLDALRPLPDRQYLCAELHCSRRAPHQVFINTRMECDHAHLVKDVMTLVEAYGRGLLDHGWNRTPNGDAFHANHDQGKRYSSRHSTESLGFESGVGGGSAGSAEQQRPKVSLGSPPDLRRSKATPMKPLRLVASLARALSDSSARVIVMDRRDRPARFGVEHLQGALAAQGGPTVVVDDCDASDDLVRDLIEVLQTKRNRATRAVTAAKCGPGWDT